jgi:hypothetical protein
LFALDWWNSFFKSQQNVGIWKLNETYNRALQCSKGEFIAILEGDDYWPSYKLKMQLSAFKKKQVVLSWGKAALTDENGMTIGFIPKNLKWFNNKSTEKLLKRLLVDNFIPACTVMCRKNALLNCGGFKQPKNMAFVDYPTWLEIILQGEFFQISEILGYWRQHKKQVTRTIEKIFFQSYKYSIDFYNQLPQELKKSIKINYKDLLVYHQYSMANTFLYLGRIALTECKWKNAKINFLEAINKGSISTKIKAIFGLICCHCRMNLEWLVRTFDIP